MKLRGILIAKSYFRIPFVFIFLSFWLISHHTF